MADAIKFSFNSRKATQAAAYLLKLAGGKMDARKLATMLYLADRSMLLSHGRALRLAMMAAALGAG